ncbi:uncharacterized protein LOC135208383 [Macrobrachium nipponense]|uniref:uncharacterized protein LOC135208383 n=1 Tax=Macrobrachium nipponense TaxID=159736 RepID=UPI0030C8ACF3
MKTQQDAARLQEKKKKKSQKPEKKQPSEKKRKRSRKEASEEERKHELALKEKEREIKWEKARKESILAQATLPASSLAPTVSHSPAISGQPLTILPPTSSLLEEVSPPVNPELVFEGDSMEDSFTSPHQIPAREDSSPVPEHTASLGDSTDSQPVGPSRPYRPVPREEGLAFHKRQEPLSRITKGPALRGIAPPVPATGSAFPSPDAASALPLPIQVTAAPGESGYGAQSTPSDEGLPATLQQPLLRSNRIAARRIDRGEKNTSAFRVQKKKKKKEEEEEEEEEEGDESEPKTDVDFDLCNSASPVVSSTCSSPLSGEILSKLTSRDEPRESFEQ